MSGFGPVIYDSPPVIRRLPEKAILWAVQHHCGNLENGDSNRFPTRDEVNARKNVPLLTELNSFAEAVAEAQEKVWIVDEYLLRPRECTPAERVDQILKWIPNTIVASDIKLLVKGHEDERTNDFLDEQFQRHAAEVNRTNTRRVQQLKIEVNFTLMTNFDLLHDRFAIVDDELWHFGAAVAGLHWQVSATTRGWRASDHRAEDFFKLAWGKETRRMKGAKKK
ncbi:hypothetical protein [Burkholderia pyrrocinia]